jgi:hypothetical protein
MKKSSLGTSIAEALVVTVIITMWLTGMYTLFINSQKAAINTGNRIQAVQMAREWLEAMINIRDTNALLFGSDMKNCWNTLNYDKTCIGNVSNSTDISHLGEYTVYKDSDTRWKLKPNLGLAGGYIYTNPNYKNAFKIQLDSDGLYTQSGGITMKPLFTREIKTTYTWPAGVPVDNDSIIVDSIVQWGDNSSTSAFKVQLQTVLTNWKGKN